MAKTFNDVQVFFEFLSVLNDPDKRKKIDGVTVVDLLTNLDPNGQTNTAIEMAKIYSWYNQLIDYDSTTGTFAVKTSALPDDVKNVAEGYYDPATGKFYTDSTKTTEIPGESGTLYIDTTTDTIYRYDEGTSSFVTVAGTDTTYAFREGSVDGSFQVQEDGGAWQTINIHNAATLDSTGKVPASQLPSYVDDVIEGYYDPVTDKFYEDTAKTTEITPETGKIYTDLSTDTTWRWSGTQYTQIKGDIALGETHTTAYYGDLGKVAYDHSQITSGNPHNVTKSDVGLSNVNNTADADKVVKSAGKLTTAANIDGVDFDGSSDIIHYAECSTAAATVAKTVDCAGFKLVTGAWIAIKFTITNTGAVASLTLNVNNTGAKNIKYRNANLSSAGVLAADRTYMFVYDGTYYQLIGDLDTTGSDTKVRQTLLTTDTKHPILMAYSDNTVTTANVDNVSYRVNTVYINPSTGSIYTTNLYATGEIVADSFQTTSGGDVVTDDDILVLHCTNNPSVLS